MDSVCQPSWTFPIAAQPQVLRCVRHQACSLLFLLHCPGSWERPFSDVFPLESDRLIDPVSWSKWLPLFMFWVPCLQNGNRTVTDFHGDVKMKQGGTQHVAYLTSTQQTLTLLFLDQHLVSVEVIAKGSLALLLKGHVILPSLSPSPAWWFPHLQKMTVSWILWEPGQPLETGKRAPSVQTRKQRHTLKLTRTGK